ncbi:MAG: hypothetical protein WCA89_17085 [Terracidiphilus sp.]
MSLVNPDNHEEKAMKPRNISLTAVVLAFTLAAGAYAQKPAATSAADTLTWISNHFETATEYVRVLSEVKHQPHSTTTTYIASMTFQGCKVTLITSQQFLHVAADGATDNDYSGTVTEQFELNNLRPDKIRVVSRDQESCFSENFTDDASMLGKVPDCPDKKGIPNPPQLITLLLPAVTPIPSTDSAWGFSTPVKSIQIRFSTLEMANRQAKAWSTAILACGGK